LSLDFGKLRGEDRVNRARFPEAWNPESYVILSEFDSGELK